MPGEASADPLRIRYYEWCSAKVAERFLRLSAEEVWQRVAQIREAPDPPGAPEEERELFVDQNTFEVVRVLAHRLAEEMQLPAFEHWVSEYRDNPQRFEQEILEVGGPSLIEPAESKSPGEPAAISKPPD